MSLQESSSKAGRRRLPPPARRYSPISVMARTSDTVSRPNSRSIAARSSCRRSKTSLALRITVMFKVGPLVRSIICELHVDTEIGLLEHGDDLLQRVAVFAANAHKITLNRCLYLEFGILNELDDLSSLFDRNSLLQTHLLPHRRTGSGVDCAISERFERHATFDQLALENVVHRFQLVVVGGA